MRGVCLASLILSVPNEGKQSHFFSGKKTLLQVGSCCLGHFKNFLNEVKQLVRERIEFENCEKSLSALFALKS